MRQLRHVDSAATAAALALAAVTLTQSAHPLGSDSWRMWADAVVNEWLVWFTIAYLTLAGALALVARLPVRWPARRRE